MTDATDSPMTDSRGLIDPIAAREQYSKKAREHYSRLAQSTDYDPQADGEGSYDDAIGTLRKLEIAKAALVRIMRDCRNRSDGSGATENIYRTAHDALIKVESSPDPVNRG